MLTAQNISYIHPDKELLFENITFSISKQDKVALIGNNGSGKSTFLKVLAGILPPAAGVLRYSSTPYYVPQHFGQFNDLTVAGALHIEKKLEALREILNGNVSEKYMTLLNEDWTIEERCQKALAYWGIQDIPLTEKMNKLSGGEKTKVFLAGIFIHKPGIVLLDEPTNHLDLQSRELLYHYVSSCSETLVVVSHDRLLLDLVHTVYELEKGGVTAYGGNFSFYREQKEMAEQAAVHQVKEKEKTLRKEKKLMVKSLERQQRKEVRGSKKHEKEGGPRILAHLLKNKAEMTSSRLKDTHSDKIEIISNELAQARMQLPEMRRIKMDFENSSLHVGKILVTAKMINFGYQNQMLWNEPLSFQIRSGERINLKGKNGSGKTTLIKIILGEIQPSCGIITRAGLRSIYIDQDYSLIKDHLTIYEQACQYNYSALKEHEIKIRLARYLFHREVWDKPCYTLSGGEKMRLMLCCLMIGNRAPDMFVLDEPTNNLDIQNTEMLTAAIQEYSGTLLVVSHDSWFLKEINIGRTIDLDAPFEKNVFI